MEREKFRRLLVEHANKTANIRAFRTWDYSGVYRVSDAITEKTGNIVAWLQAKIDEGHFCKKNEYLMIYNFQPLHMSDRVYLCSLDMVIKPVKEINELENNDGVPFQLVINGITGEIGNNAYGLAIIMRETEDEMEMEEEEPLVYGNYKEKAYFEPLSHNFVEHLSQLQVTMEDLKGKEGIEFKKKAEENELAHILSHLAINFPFQPVQPAVAPSVFDSRQPAPPPSGNVYVAQGPRIVSAIRTKSR